MAKTVKNLNILIVEDEVVILQDLCALIEDAGDITCKSATGVVEALALIDTTPLDGAILDINLGNTDCTAVARSLKERKIPFIVVTGYDNEDVPLELQGAPFLAKPFAGAALVDAVRRTFTARRAPDRS